MPPDPTKEVALYNTILKAVIDLKKGKPTEDEYKEAEKTARILFKGITKGNPTKEQVNKTLSGIALDYTKIKNLLIGNVIDSTKSVTQGVRDSADLVGLLEKNKKSTVDNLKNTTKTKNEMENKAFSMSNFKRITIDLFNSLNLSDGGIYPNNQYVNSENDTTYSEHGENAIGEFPLDRLANMYNNFRGNKGGKIENKLRAYLKELRSGNLLSAAQKYNDRINTEEFKMLKSLTRVFMDDDNNLFSSGDASLSATVQGLGTMIQAMESIELARGGFKKTKEGKNGIDENNLKAYGDYLANQFSGHVEEANKTIRDEKGNLKPIGLEGTLNDPNYNNVTITQDSPVKDDGIYTDKSLSPLPDSSASQPTNKEKAIGFFKNFNMYLDSLGAVNGKQLQTPPSVGQVISDTQSSSDPKNYQQPLHF